MRKAHVTANTGYSLISPGSVIPGTDAKPSAKCPWKCADFWISQ